MTMTKAMKETNTKMDASLVTVEAVAVAEAMADTKSVAVTMAVGVVVRATTMGTKARTIEAPHKDLTAKVTGAVATSMSTTCLLGSLDSKAPWPARAFTTLPYPVP